jgi:hypothetical protein
MDTEPHQFPLSAEQWQILTNLSSQTGKPPEAILSDALRQYSPDIAPNGEQDQPSDSLYDRLAKKGLIGCIKGGPPDLSTNPKYMEGFGEDRH